jgi:hypothetical protein
MVVNNPGTEVVSRIPPEMMSCRCIQFSRPSYTRGRETIHKVHIFVRDSLRWTTCSKIIRHQKQFPVFFLSF